MLLIIAVFSTSLLPHPSQAQIFSSTPHSLTPSTYVSPSISATKCHTHTEQQVLCQLTEYNTNLNFTAYKKKLTSEFYFSSAFHASPFDTTTSTTDTMFLHTVLQPLILSLVYRQALPYSVQS